MFEKKKKDKQKPTENNLLKPEKLDDEILGQVTGGRATSLNDLMKTVNTLENTSNPNK